MNHPEFAKFKEEISTKYVEEVDVTSDGGVVKKIITHGDGPMPNHGQEVKVNFSAKVEGNLDFDSSNKRKGPLTINVGSG